MSSVIVVGAGLSGATAARILAENGFDVGVYEKRGYIGGNCADCYDTHGILVHRHGPHAFHTNDAEVWDFMSRFAKWSSYKHKVMAVLGGKVLPMPVNLTTIEKAYAEKWMIFHADKGQYTVRELMEHRDPEMNKLGHWIWQNFYLGYSSKQWGVHPDKLPNWIIDRVPVRFTNDLYPHYHLDTYQGLPHGGYTAMIERMLDHNKIEVKLNHAVTLPGSHMIYTGDLAELFQFQHGTLPYRSLKFEWEHSKHGPIQKVAQYNYPEIELPYTRVVEYRIMTDGDEWRGSTTLCREFPSEHGEPYYPVANEEADELHARYSAMAQKAGVWCLGRLAEYRYINMDQSVRKAMDLAKQFSDGKGQA